MPWSSTIAPIASPWAAASAVPAPPPLASTSRRPKTRPEPARMEVELAVVEVDLTDSEAIRRLHGRARAMLARPNVKRLSIDLRTVASADSKLVACLVALHRLARSRNAAMDVRIAPALRDVFVLFRLERLLPEPMDAAPESQSA